MFGRKTWANGMSRRGKVLLLAAVLLLSTIVFPFLPAQPAYADTASDIQDINDKHYAATYLRDCLYQTPAETKNRVLQSRLSDYNYTRFFASNSWLVGIGAYMEPTDGVAGCTEGELVRTALRSLGYESNPGKFWTDIGYTVSKTRDGCPTASTCQNGEQDVYTRPPSGDKFNTVFSSALSTQPYHARYVAYRSIFNARCKLVEPPTGEGSAVTYKKVVLGSDGNYIVQDAKAEFVKNNPGRKDEFDTGRTQIKSFEYENKNTTCGELLGALDLLASHVADYNNKHKDDPITDGMGSSGDGTDCTAKPDAEGCGEDAPTCTDQVKGIGWLICPTMEFLANINDMAYGVLASNFLQIDTGLVKGAEAPWAKFKDLANIAFVIALLFVIYSQVTSVGISNYGIKKMLPKIIVAALLVNLSFIICQIAVDLSNILGYGISRFFTGLEVGATLDSTTQDKLADKGLETFGIALNWTGAIGLIMVAGVSIAMAVSFPVVLSALLALAMIVLILLARKALIVLLIVIAPLAFVAYLLPNTEQWFKKWAKMFSTLLLLFPIIGLVFGASALAAKIVAAAGGNKDDPDPLIQLAALGISALPFFVVPGLLKGAINAAGALGTKLSGLADRAGKSAGSSARKKSKERFDNSYLGRNLAERKKIAATRRAMIAAGTYTGRNSLHRARSAAFGALNSSRLSGKAGDKMATMGAALQDKEFQEEVSAITSSFEAKDHKNIIDVATGKAAARSDAHRVAAIQYAAKSGSASDIAGMEVDKDASSSVKNAAISAFKEKKIHNLAGNGVLSKIATEGTSQAAVDEQIVDRLENGQISAESFVQSESTTTLLGGSLDREHAKGHKLTQAGKARVQKVVNEVYSNESTKKAVQGDVEQGINDMGSVLGRP